MTDKDEREYERDISSGRRVEYRIGDDLIISIQYFPEFNNVSFSFYAKNMPGFTIGIPTEKWSDVRKFISEYEPMTIYPRPVI